MKTVSKIISAAAVAALLPLSAFAYTAGNDSGPLVTAQSFEGTATGDVVASLAPLHVQTNAPLTDVSRHPVTPQSFSAIARANVSNSDLASVNDPHTPWLLPNTDRIASLD